MSSNQVASPTPGASIAAIRAGSRTPCTLNTSEACSNLSYVLRRLGLWWKTFTPVETAVLKEVARCLSPPAAGKLERQIDAIDKVQRIDQWREIDFYSKRGRALLNAPENLFRRRAELELARLRFRADGEEFDCRVHAVAGRIFSLAISPSIKPRAFAEQVEIVDCQIVTDPEAEAEPVRAMALFPASYRSFIASSPGQDADDWLVLEPGDSHSVNLEGRCYLVLASRGGDELLVTPESDDDRIYYTATGVPPRTLGTDFTVALKSGTE